VPGGRWVGGQLTDRSVATGSPQAIDGRHRRLLVSAPANARCKSRAEYVVIRNGDNVSHPVSGWTVRDAAGHVYKFGTLRLGAGKQAIIHTGDGTKYTTSASTHLYWGREWYVWNKTGDKVILRRADGSLKDTCTYSGVGRKKYC
jgi:hypothetical protein